MYYSVIPHDIFNVTVLCVSCDNNIHGLNCSAQPSFFVSYSSDTCKQVIHNNNVFKKTNTNNELLETFILLFISQGYDDFIWVF